MKPKRGRPVSQIPAARTSGQHKNPRMLITATREELDAWARAAAAEDLDRSAWLRALANDAAAAAPQPETGESGRRAAWREARRADVLAVAAELKKGHALTPARLESILAKRSGFEGWTVKFDGPEFEAKPPPMPKDWEP